MPVLAPSGGRRTVQMPTVWSPLARQELEADTTYLMDLDAEATKVAGVDGLAAGAEAFSTAVADKAPWEGGTKMAVVAGKYRTGLKCLSSDQYLYMPLAGLLGAAEFTVECWVAHTSSWATARGNVFRVEMSGTEDMLVDFPGNNTLTVRYRHNHSPTATLLRNINYTLPAIAADVFNHVALTLLDGTLRLYLNGVQVGSATGCTAPVLWASSEVGGLSICGGGGVGAVGMTVSDLRVSRRARVPSTGITVARGRNVVAVDVATTTGATLNQKLRGGLHDFRNDATAATAAGAVNVIRTDKVLTITPIKAGGTNAAHPTLGNSGLYSYDWQVLDRWLDSAHGRGGAEPYISLDSCPQLLGGSLAPDATAPFPSWSNFAREVPNDFGAFATMCSDLIHHVTVTRGISAPYWGVWNEPHDNGSFWAGTQAQWFALYAAVAARVRADFPSLKIGGPEGAPASWIQPFLSYCQTNAVPLDFISWHPYDGRPSQVQEFYAFVERARTAAGFTGALELLNGEWSSVSNSGFFGAGRRPWRDYQWGINDWAAANLAANLIEHQRVGVKRAIFTNMTGGFLGDTGYYASQLFDNGTGRTWATGNVYRLWARMEPAVVSHTLSAGPEFFALASKNTTTGKVTVLVVRLRYRLDSGVPVVVELPGVATGRAVTATMVDDARSNAYQVGDNGALQTVVPDSGATVVNARVQLTMAARAVCLLEIAP